MNIHHLAVPQENKMSDDERYAGYKAEIIYIFMSSKIKESLCRKTVKIMPCLQTEL